MGTILHARVRYSAGQELVCLAVVGLGAAELRFSLSIRRFRFAAIGSCHSQQSYVPVIIASALLLGELPFIQTA
jgi:hypothetical protein